MDIVAPSAGELDDALRNLQQAGERPYYEDVRDQNARDAYYADVEITADSAGNYRILCAHLSATHKVTLDYQPLRYVYPWVDLHPDLLLRSIYSGKSLDPEDTIRNDYAIQMKRLRLARSLDTMQESDSGGIGPVAELIEESLPYNCEHVVPQSWFRKAQPMRGDLHHLFTCEVGCNSFRGNSPYFDFPDFWRVVRSECGKREPEGFEPFDGKGTVARATLYFLLRYPGELDAVPREYVYERIETLVAWHSSKPPTLHERHRNAAIFEQQGNRNPLIDHPEWASRIEFLGGLGRSVT